MSYSPEHEEEDDYFLSMYCTDSVLPKDSASQISPSVPPGSSSTAIIINPGYRPAPRNSSQYLKPPPPSPPFSSFASFVSSSSSSSSRISSKQIPARPLRHRPTVSDLPKILDESAVTVTVPVPVTPPKSSSSSPVEIPPQDLEDLIPLSEAISRCRDTKARLATAHEGIRLAARTLHEAGVVPANQALTAEIKEFDTAIFARYTAASFLWNVLRDLTCEENEGEGEWLGKGDKFDDSVRRIKTLKGLEGSLRCWEGVVFELLGIVDRVQEEKEEDQVRVDGKSTKKKKNKKKVDEEEVGRVLGRWRVGVPSRP